MWLQHVKALLCFLKIVSRVIEHNAKARGSQHQMEFLPRISPEAHRALETQREYKVNGATNGSTRDEQVPHHNNEPHPEVLRQELQASGYRHTQKRVQEHVQQDRRVAEQSQGSLKQSRSSASTTAPIEYQRLFRQEAEGQAEIRRVNQEVVQSTSALARSQATVETQSSTISGLQAKRDDTKKMRCGRTMNRCRTRRNKRKMRQRWSKIKKFLSKSSPINTTLGCPGKPRGDTIDSVEPCRSRSNVESTRRAKGQKIQRRVFSDNIPAKLLLAYLLFTSFWETRKVGTLLHQLRCKQSLIIDSSPSHQHCPASLISCRINSATGRSPRSPVRKLDSRSMPSPAYSLGSDLQPSHSAS